MSVENKGIEAKNLNLRVNLPPIPARPDTDDFSRLALMLDGEDNPVFKFQREAEIRIGRPQENEERWDNFDLSAYDDEKISVSRRHCQIFWENGVCFIEDMESRNGTWVNGTRIAAHKRAKLKTGDYIQVGKVGFWVFLPNAVANTPQNTN